MDTLRKHATENLLKEFTSFEEMRKTIYLFLKSAGKEYRVSNQNLRGAGGPQAIILTDDRGERRSVGAVQKPILTEAHIDRILALIPYSF
jgi:hypothetical protein